MSGIFKKHLILGFIIWGLSIFSPFNNACAEISDKAKLGEIGANQKGLGSDTAGAQLIRLGGDEAAKHVAEKSGYSSENIRAFNSDDLKNEFGNIADSAKETAASAQNKAKGLFSGTIFEGGKLDQMAQGLAYVAGGVAGGIGETINSAQTISSAAMVYEADDGTKIYLNKDMEATKGVMRDCVPLPLKLGQNKECIFCPLFSILFSAVQVMSSYSYNTLAQGFINLLLIGFALYVSFVTLKQVSSFTKQDAPKYITDLLTMAFKVLLAYMILKNVLQLYQLVLEPLLNTAMEFGSAFLFRSGSSQADKSFIGCSSTTELTDGLSVASGYYSTALFAKVNCFIFSIQKELSIAISTGSSLMCVAVNSATNLGFIPDFSMLICGFVLWALAWLLTLAFAFYLIDAVVRLGIIGGLMPFLIAAWPFKITRGYTKKGWDMFLNTFFTFVFLGLVISVSIELAFQSMNGGEGGFEKIQDLLNGDQVEPLKKAMDISGLGMVFMILCCIFAFKLCGEATNLAAQMSGASSSDIGSRIASLGGGVAKWGAKTAGKGALKAGKAVGKLALMATPVGRAVMAKKESVGKSLFQGASKVGDRIGLKGFGGGGGGKGGGGGGPRPNLKDGPKVNNDNGGGGGPRPNLKDGPKVNNDNGGGGGPRPNPKDGPEVDNGNGGGGGPKPKPKDGPEVNNDNGGGGGPKPKNSNSPIGDNQPNNDPDNGARKAKPRNKQTNQKGNKKFNEFKKIIANNARSKANKKNNKG